eukprot:6180263-Pleurochrysis_carterae.AAC.1
MAMLQTQPEVRDLPEQNTASLFRPLPTAAHHSSDSCIVTAARQHASVVPFRSFKTRTHMTCLLHGRRQYQLFSASGLCTNLSSLLSRTQPAQPGPTELILLLSLSLTLTLPLPLPLPSLTLTLALTLAVKMLGMVRGCPPALVALVTKQACASAPALPVAGKPHPRQRKHTSQTRFLLPCA